MNIDRTSPAHALLLGDCAEQMRGLSGGCVDAIVTDPPYGIAFMGAKWDNFGGKSCGNDSAEVRRQKAEEYAAKNTGAPRYANGHGGAPTLDSMRSFQSYMTPIFAEALRVAKPGAHLLAFGGTRTYHRLACAIEDAGWEIRDCIMWVYGSGFPKSMDVSKAINKAMGAERTEVVGTRHRNVKPYDDGNGWNANNTTGDYQYMAPATPEAAAWQGFGTQLKPAVEPIVVARKPLEGTVAANILKYGTGAINIDGCRVATDDNLNGGAYSKNGNRNNLPGDGRDEKGAGMFASGKTTEKDFVQPLGRFPANLIHDGSPEVLACFPESKGQCGAVKGTEPSRTGSNGIYGNYNGQNTMSPRGDTGSAARFFYCAKASRSERGEGNVHPTVKPIALMRYLVRLVTRKGGIVLDPFMGSGTTGVAAINEGMKFVGIERDPQYYDIASRRVNDAKPIPPTTTQQELPLCE